MRCKVLTAKQIGAFFEGDSYEKFLDVSKQRVLGASRHIRLIGDMISYLGSLELPREEMERRIRETGEFFIGTRGMASCAITNAVRKMFTLIFEEGLPPETAVETYFRNYAADVDRVIAYTLDVIREMKAVMLYDYSSTVDKAFAEAAGQEICLDIYIPESRILDGGMPYVRSLSGKGHTLHVIPDSAIMYYLEKCDAAFIGAETCFPDGTSFNTTGSEMTAVLCRMLGKAFYVLTPMLKVDTRAFDPAFEKEPVWDDLGEKLAKGIAGLDCECPEITAVPPEDITGIVTENGVYTPAAFLVACEALMKEQE